MSARGCARDKREVMATAAETALWAAAMGGCNVEVYFSDRCFRVMLKSKKIYLTLK